MEKGGVEGSNGDQFNWEKSYLSTFKVMGAGCPSSLLKGIAFQRAIVFSDMTNGSGQAYIVMWCVDTEATNLTLTWPVLMPWLRADSIPHRNSFSDLFQRVLWISAKLLSITYTNHEQVPKPVFSWYPLPQESSRLVLSQNGISDLVRKFTSQQGILYIHGKTTIYSIESSSKACIFDKIRLDHLPANKTSNIFHSADLKWNGP